MCQQYLQGNNANTCRAQWNLLNGSRQFELYSSKKYIPVIKDRWSVRSSNLANKVDTRHYECYCSFQACSQVGHYQNTILYWLYIHNYHGTVVLTLDAQSQSNLRVLIQPILISNIYKQRCFTKSVYILQEVEVFASRAYSAYYRWM